MALPCSCKEHKIEGEINKNQIHFCERCNRVIMNNNLKTNKMKKGVDGL